jgi:hypothetical protein
MGAWMYKSKFSWPRHWLEVGGELHVPVALSPGKELLALSGQEVGWAPEPVWTIRRSENSWPYLDSISDPSVVQPVASRYTDYATEAHTSGSVATRNFFNSFMNIHGSSNKVCHRATYVTAVYHIVA